LAGTKWLVDAFEESAKEWEISKNNLFSLNLAGAGQVDIALFHEGAIEKVPALAREGRILPARGVYRFLVQALTQSNRVDHLMTQIKSDWCRRPEAGQNGWRTAIEGLEAMVNDGWVRATFTPELPRFKVEAMEGAGLFHPNTDNLVPADSVSSAND
jgi:hypothetical protein